MTEDNMLRYQGALKLQNEISKALLANGILTSYSWEDVSNLVEDIINRLYGNEFNNHIADKELNSNNLIH